MGVGKNFTDFALFVETDIKSEEVYLVKLVKQTVKQSKSAKPKPLSLAQIEAPGVKVHPDFSVRVEGVSDAGEVIFLYENKKDAVSQSFGINIKKYYAH